MQPNLLSVADLRKLCKSIGIENSNLKKKNELVAEIESYNAQVKIHLEEIEKYEKLCGQSAFDKIGFENKNASDLRNITSKMKIKGFKQMKKNKLLEAIKNTKNIEAITYKHYDLKRLAHIPKTETEKLTEALEAEERKECNQLKPTLEKLSKTGDPNHILCTKEVAARYEEMFGHCQNILSEIRKKQKKFNILEEKAKKTAAKRKKIKSIINKITPEQRKEFEQCKRKLVQEMESELEKEFRPVIADLGFRVKSELEESDTLLR